MNPAELVTRHTVYRAVVGSRAQGLSGPDSDTDRRGVYLPPTPEYWGLDKPPDHVDGPDPELFSWELERCCVLALVANPTVWECLWSPLVEIVTPVGEELLALRGSFLSLRAYDSYARYATSQLRKLDAGGPPRPKHAVHLVRTLLTGRTVLAEGVVPVDVGPHRQALLDIRHGQMPWPRIREWTTRLAADLTEARATSPLPPSPDRARVDDFLRRARRSAL
ncbi:MAG: DNA polymerase beta superfamily protein [Mycobacteriales bacterium]